MKGFVLGIVLGIIAVAGATYLYFASGWAPVATAAQAMPFEKKLAKIALQARLDKEMPKTVPIQADDPNLIAGARVYMDHCAVCHSLPGQPETTIAKGMFPKPPELFKGKGVTDDPAGETYWKAANGIRLSGMPAFKGEVSDTQLWQVSLLLATADKISPAVKAILAQPVAAVPGPTP